MIKIPINEKLLPAARTAHADAITAYVKRQNTAYQKKLYYEIENVLPSGSDFDTAMKDENWQWLRAFILAEVDTLREMTTKPANLQFDEFKKLYINKFSAGSGKYVDDASRYNAYAFIKNIGITVCPYCDEEYLDVIEKSDGGMIRTLEIDHFFPKNQYPALAMCFYNLIPSGQNCNGMKLEHALGMNPFEENIEQCSWLYPDLPVGINMETVPVEDCTIHFHPKGGMVQNVEVLHLEERYERHKGRAHRYMLIKQQYNDVKVEELVKMGVFRSKDHAYRLLYGESLVDDGEQQLLAKLKRDITGR